MCAQGILTHFFSGCGPTWAILKTWQFFLYKSQILYFHYLMSMLFLSHIPLQLFRWSTFIQGQICTGKGLWVQQTMQREKHILMLSHWLHPSPCPSPPNTWVISSLVNQTQAWFLTKKTPPNLQVNRGLGSPQWVLTFLYQDSATQEG